MTLSSIRKLYGLLESPALPPSIPTHQFKLFLVGRQGEYFAVSRSEYSSCNVIYVPKVHQIREAFKKKLTFVKPPLDPPPPR